MFIYIYRLYSYQHFIPYLSILSSIRAFDDMLGVYEPRLMTGRIEQPHKITKNTSLLDKYKLVEKDVVFSFLLVETGGIYIQRLAKFPLHIYYTLPLLLHS